MACNFVAHINIGYPDCEFTDIFCATQDEAKAEMERRLEMRYPGQWYYKADTEQYCHKEAYAGHWVLGYFYSRGSAETERKIASIQKRLDAKAKKIRSLKAKRVMLFEEIAELQKMQQLQLDQEEKAAREDCVTNE